MIRSRTDNLATLGALVAGKIPRRPSDSAQDRPGATRQLRALDAGLAGLMRVRADLKRYRAEVLDAAVAGKFCSPAHRAAFHPSRWKPIEDVIQDLEQGCRPRCENKASQGPDTWAVMTSAAIGPMKFDETRNKVLASPPKTRAVRQALDYAALEVRPGDCLITTACRAAHCCLVTMTRPKLLVCAEAYRFTCRRASALGSYIEIALNAEPMLRAIEATLAGTSRNGAVLTEKGLRQLRLPIPSLKVQQETVTTVQRRLSAIEALETDVDRGLRRAARLRQAILTRALQGCSACDEPTAVLRRLRCKPVSPQPVKKGLRVAHRKQPPLAGITHHGVVVRPAASHCENEKS